MKKVVTLQKLKNKHNTERQHTVNPDLQACRLDALKLIAKSNVYIVSFVNMASWTYAN